jgi:phospholipid/cholesterol/gamma-HCH transport system substrate-binding protein
MLDQTKNVLIGLFVAAALAIVVYILLFLHPSIGNEASIIHVRFADIDKISVGTRVLFAGHPIGEVTAINEVAGARSPDQLREGEVYIYEVTLAVDSGVAIYTSDEIAAHTSGLLGEKSVTITPRLPPPGEPLVPVDSKTILYAAAPISVDEAIRSFKDLAAKAGITIDKVNEQLTILKDKQFWENLSITAENLGDITTAMNRPEELAGIVTNFFDFSAGINELQKDVRPKVNESMDNIVAMSTNAKDVVVGVKEGRGSIGKIVSDEEFYLSLKSFMSKGSTLMDDINHYGLLFHNNKEWQRVRARRVNLLATLSTPQEFQNFFNDEVDEIMTSLARVSMVLRKSECEGIPAFTEPGFMCVFAELLKRVEQLEENIRLYNIQAMDQRNDECPWFLRRETTPQACAEK